MIMRRYPFLVLLACVLPLGVGCGSSGGGGDTDARPNSYENVCSRYEAVCPSVGNASGSISTCDEECQLILEGPAHLEDRRHCLFMYCGLEVGLCDNDETNDASIFACAQARSFRNVCSRYEAVCPSISNTSEPISTCDQECQTVLGGPATEQDQNHCRVMFCGLDVGLCENEQPNNQAISRCRMERGWVH